MTAPWTLIAFCILILFSATSCYSPNDNNEAKSPDIEEIKTPLENANRHMIKTEEDEINSYIKRYNWKMTKTPTGLRYFIYKKGEGDKVKVSSIVKIKYDLRLINGTPLYSSETDGIKTIVMGKSTSEQGLEEGLLQMRHGDKAKLIIPSHLGFGLHGDDNKIPKRATLIYDLEIISIDNP